MSRHTPVEILEVIAADLATLCEEVVFVGGAIVALLITDSAAPPVSSTKDIDIVVSVTTNFEYNQELGGRLRKLGFKEDSSEEAPLCRWLRTDGLKLDVMPTNPGILGFSNQWFPLTFETAVVTRLPSGREIRVATAPCFLGTKLVAFDSRGGGDYQASKDIEDLLAVIHGRSSIVQEVSLEREDLKSFLVERIRHHLDQEDFTTSIDGHLPGENQGSVLSRLCQICAIELLPAS